MKIAYVNIVWRPSAGVIEKVRAVGEAASALHPQALDVFLCVPAHLRPGPDSMAGVVVVPVPVPVPRKVGIPLMSALVWHRLVPILAGYDAVVVRWTTPSPQFRRFVRNHVVFTEHHSMEVPEQQSKRGVLNRALELLERYYGPRILSRARGVIAVTGEIRDYELVRAGRSLPTLVLPNGVAVADFQPDPERTPAPQRISLAFVSSRFASWQGLDRLVAGLRAWRSPTPAIHLHIVGELNAAQERELRTLDFGGEVHLHGVLEKAPLAALLARCDVGIGSLAVHRKALREACALKVREYVASGLPVVIGYSDPDLPSDLPWVYRIPADESPVAVAELVQFVIGIRARPAVCAEMRRFAMETLDWKPKLRALGEFVAAHVEHESTRAASREP